MNPDPKFVVTLDPSAAQRLGRTDNRLIEEAGGSVDLWEQLEEMGLAHEDVVFINLEGESGENRIICNAVRELEQVGCHDVYLAVDPDASVYLLASVQHGGLIEFQVSDGPAGDRGTSYDCYEFTEAKRIFDEVVEKGWKNACKA